MIEGNIVDVRHKRVFPGRVEFENGLVKSVEEVSAKYDTYLIPGLIDAHIHIESSLTVPSRFAEAVVPHGTTAVVTDPHEIANVLGMQGIDYMVKDSKTVPLRVYFTAPSCVPATPFETAGAALGPAEIEQLLSRPEFVALGEMMNYPGAIRKDPEVISKIDVAKKLAKPIDGHAPMVTGADLKEYIGLGISTDHECSSAEEAREKHDLGMRIMVRQGSASKNLIPLIPFAKQNEFILVSDDKNVSDLLAGHIDRTLSLAVASGVDPLHALRAATINPALHYGLPIGAIEPGLAADIVRVRDLRNFEAEEVYIGGELVAANGIPKFEVKPKEMVSQFILQRRTPSDFEIPAAGPMAEVRVIGLIPDELTTKHLTATLMVENGKVMPNLEQDIVRIAVVNRYKDAPVSNGFVKGFGLKRGSIASSVAHDSHNIIVVGVQSEEMAVAVNALIGESGGFCVNADGKCSMLNLRVAGLMCTRPVSEVKRMLDSLVQKAKEMGCALEDPFMTLSFLSLLVIPSLKIGDRGLFDVEDFQFVDVIIRGR
ncbi:MAG: adenine deaminase [Candidatus Thermoplasmatota archaeon]|nr:adenine deaminase [Candidatus Thermoplasmatota archaeon]